MQKPYHIRQWMLAWNDIIRYVFFSDQLLKKLMMLPLNTSIIKFIDQYFIRAGYTSKTLSNEPVRIVYSLSGSALTGVLNVLKQLLEFDIYVNVEHLHDVENDRLVMRTQLIADRIMTLLTKDRYVQNSGFRFWPIGDFDLGSKTIGYVRYHLSFNFFKTY